MNGVWSANPLTVIWIVFSYVLLVGITAAAVLLIRRGLFGDQQHARSLPLHSAIPDDEPSEEEQEVGHA